MHKSLGELGLINLEEALICVIVQMGVESP
jgi:hypothetical protein